MRKTAAAWAWRAPSVEHLRLQVCFALLALFALALAGLWVGGSSPSVPHEVSALSLPATAPGPRTASPNAPSKAAQRAAQAHDKLPLAFVPNRGQTDESVRYYVEGTGRAFYFLRDKAVLTFTKKDRGVALHLTPRGGSPSARLVARERAPGEVNYLIGSEQHGNLPTYRELAYRNIWPGVDLVFRGREGTLKYELRVQPGADLSKIGFAYRGADGVSVGTGGALLVQTPLGRLRDARPRSYQVIGGKRVPVESRYAVKSSHANAYGFALGSSYDPDHPLVIDPGIEYSTYLGGSGSDRADGVAVDGAGSAYVTGRANAGFPATAGAFDTSSNGPSGGGDAYVAKLNTTGSTLEYSTYIGGATGGDSGLAIAIDALGSAYITGSTSSSDFPTTPGAYDTTYNGTGGSDAFVTKLTPDGSALGYSTYLGGSNSSGFFDLGSGIAVDASGAAYVAGEADSSNFPVTSGAFDTTDNGGTDAFVTKLSPTGSSLAYSTYIGGSSFDASTALALDGSGNAYIAGYGTSTDYPTTAGAFDTSYNQGWDVFVTKVDASGGSLSYSTYLGGATYDEARGIAVDRGGSAYVTGHTFSSGYPTTAGAFDTGYDNSVGGSDAFVTKLDASGAALSYSTFLGGSGDDLGEGIAVDASGGAYVTGYTETTNFPTANATDSTYNGGSFDVFVTRLGTAGGSLDFSTYLGGSSDDRGYGVTIDRATGMLYVAGQTNSSGFPKTAGAFDTTYNGGFDAFVTKLPPLGSTLTRAAEPVVIQQALPDQTGYAAIGLTNVQLPDRLLGMTPGDLVAFRWDGGWTQIPVQVDERAVMDLNTPYTRTRPSCSDPCYNNPPDGGAIHPEFTDPTTFVGADSDATLDANDEVALMAFDAGGQATTPYAPNGVDAASAVEVEISDPIDGGRGYAYLFKDTSGRDPAAGKDYVDYEFNLTNSPYKTGAYNPTGTAPGAGMNFGPRPETSSVATQNYRRGFTDRWYDSELRVLRGSATGVDILDRHDDQFDALDASCVRTQDTFRRGEGSFIANVDGPVRAIRDFVGANSGPHVQRQHIFYGGLEVINTFLRVHPIPGVIDFFDYSADGIGLRYENGVMTPSGLVSGTPPGGVTIDGQPDTVTGAGAATVDGFESVDGPQGGLSMPQRLLTNNPDPAYRLIYRDGNVNGQRLCTGDDQLYGASGPQLNSAVNNTDEAGRVQWGGGQYSNLFYQRSIYYEAPGEADGPRRLSEMEQPLHLSPRGIELSEQPPPSYVHPKGATPAITSLAIAYRRCAQSEANRIHGGGLAFTSCNPATPTSQSLTVGTPGANGARSNASGFVRLDVCPVPGCAAPDVRIQVGMNDVRCRPGTAPCPATNAVAGPDYGGELELMLPLRITDGWNGLPAGGEGSDAATVADLPFTAAIGCTPTADTDRGAACAVTTTANTLVPGAFRSGARANTELGQIEVHDGGADGAVATADNQLFAVQGIFVP